MRIENLQTDVLIIGGGTAGCYAALTISEHSDAKVLICEKAHIKRSGCLAAGVNALNAYIVEGRTPQDYSSCLPTSALSCLMTWQQVRRLSEVRS